VDVIVLNINIYNINIYLGVEWKNKYVHE